ncbi:MAG: carbon-nitrogen hydrolase family protein [Candidatus Aerophobetes bacterium]|nr:carbon-nitrogen hydrolase family protein [Candidatus Aerophobetes bacterium]
MNSKKIKLALIQMDCKTRDKVDNISKAVKFMGELKGKVDIVGLPEFFTTGYNLDLIGDDFYELAETIPGETTEQISRKAKEYRLAVVGSIVEKDPLCGDLLYDTAFVINREGKLVGKYRKFYLYPTEHQYFRPGKDFSVIDLEIAKLGVSICYDHAFPELFRVLSLKGAQIVFILSAIPKGYEYLLNLRARARAQDNQIFVAHVNRVGREGNIQYCGLSKVVNPKGEVVAEASSSQEEVLSVELNLNLILKEKRQERVLRSLRPEIYEYLSRLL